MNNNGKKQVWDDKFGMVEIDEKKIIDGVGKDAEIVVNSKGGKQSKSPMAMHLIDAGFLDDWFTVAPTSEWATTDKNEIIFHITHFMIFGGRSALLRTCFALYCEENDRLDKNDHENMVLVEIAKVLQEGAEKYEPNNWRLIPQEEHLNYALIHYLAYTMGDTQDNHYGHCLCRLMMAYATEKSEGFEYSKYVTKSS